MSHVESPPGEQNFRPRYRPDIDGLRALAILAVVAYHAAPTYALGGFVGVDIFFVISGYLISLIIFRGLAEGQFRFLDFYAHRARRILPALLVVAGASYAFGWFALLPEEYKQLGKYVAAGMGFAQNFVLWNEAGYFDVASEFKPLMHLWSLAVEEQFYLLYPAMVWLAWRGGRRSVVAGVVALGAASFWLSATGADRDVVATFFSPQTRFWELMAGSLLACVHEFRPWRAPVPGLHGALLQKLPGGEASAGLAQLASTVGLYLIVYAFITLDRSVPYPGALALLPVGGTFLLILAGPHAWVNRLLAVRPMVAIGLISYPLYLWHWPLLSFPHIIEGGSPSTKIRAAAVALAFVLAALTYFVVERPIRRGPPTVRKTAALGALVVIAGCTGYATFLSDGAPFRIQEAARLNAALAVAKEPALREDDLRRCKRLFLAPGDSHDCWMAKDAAPTIALIGDSHARALFPGLREVLAETGDNVFYYGGAPGCIPFFNIASFDRKTPEAERARCTEETNQALHIAEASPRIRTVILVSRGPLYLSGKGFYYGSFPWEEYHDRVMQSVDMAGLSDHYRIWETGMRRTLARLLAQGKQVVYVLDNPELGFYPSACIPELRPLRLHATTVREPCAVPRKDFDERNRRYRELVGSVLKDYPAVTVFDAAAPLCDEQWCWAMRDGIILYNDDDHLSLAGARIVAARLLPLLGPEPLRTRLDFGGSRSNGRKVSGQGHGHGI